MTRRALAAERVTRHDWGIADRREGLRVACTGVGGPRYWRVWRLQHFPPGS